MHENIGAKPPHASNLAGLALVLSPDGGMALQQRSLLAPGADQVLVRVAAAGCNRADLLQRAGRYPAPPGAPADVPGLEFAGTVEQVGPGVLGLRPGERVMGIVAGGAQAEWLLVPEALCVRVPQGLELLQAGAVPEAFFTAFEALVMQGQLRPGARVFVNAVGSGVGTAVVQLGQALGAQVVGTTRSADKLQRCRALGLHGGLVLDGTLDEAQLRERLQAEAGGPFDLAIDLLGGEHLGLALSLLGTGGTLVSLGFIAAPAAPVDLAQLVARRLRLIGTSLRSRPNHEKAVLAARFAKEVLPLLESERIKPVVEQVFDLADAAAAYALMEANRNFGKILLAPGGAGKGLHRD